MSEENEKDSETITIKKQDLWKYSTFILAALLVVGAFLYFSKGGETSSAGNTGAVVGSNEIDTSDFDWSILEDASAYPVLGPSNAKVTVVEVSDFQCPYCAMASGLSSFIDDDLKAQYGDLIGSAQKVQQLAADGEIRFIYAGAAFLGQESKNSLEAGLCANEQGKFWEMHDEIFKAHDGRENNGKYTKDKLKEIVSGISGIDKAEFNKCLDDGKYLSKVSQINSVSTSLPGFQGTPGFYVNGAQSTGSWTQLSSLLRSQGINT